MKKPTTPKTVMRKAKKLANAGRISPKAMDKMSGGLRGSQIPISRPRGGVGKGMAGM